MGIEAQELKTYVVHGGDFRERWKGCYVYLHDVDSLGGENYEDELYTLFEYYSFNFDEAKHVLTEDY